jgi:hypothetical protein
MRGWQIGSWCAQGRGDPGNRERAHRAGAGGLDWSAGAVATPLDKSANGGRLAAGAIGKLDRGETENIYSRTDG